MTHKRLLGLMGLLVAVGCGGLPAPGPKAATATARQDADSPRAPASPGALVSITQSLDGDVVTIKEPEKLVVRVEVSGNKIPNAPRPRLNLALVVDTSGSMQGEAIAQARHGARAVLGAMAPGDYLSLVTFGTRISVLMPARQLGDNGGEAIEAAVGQMQASGTSDMAGALGAALAQLETHYLRKGINRVVLLGDGVPNESAQLQALAQRAAELKITITTFGLGPEADAAILTAVAEASGGKYHAVASPDELPKVFKEEVMRLDRSVAHKATLMLSPGPGVAIRNIEGAEWSQRNRETLVTIGNLKEHEIRELSVELEVAVPRQSERAELLDALLEYTDPVYHSARRELSSFTTVRAVAAEVAAAEPEPIELDSSDS